MVRAGSGVLTMPERKITQVATGFDFTEGPVFSRRGYLLFSDIPKQRIHKLEPGTVTFILGHVILARPAAEPQLLDEVHVRE